MFIEPDKEIECSNENIMGLVIPGCHWKGKESDLIEDWFSTISPMHPLSGSEGYRYTCPKCGRTLKEIILRQS
jgi:hypothetical protein